MYADQFVNRVSFRIKTELADISDLYIISKDDGKVLFLRKSTTGSSPQKRNDLLIHVSIQTLKLYVETNA